MWKRSGPRVIREQLEGFIAPENLPTGVRTATATPVAGRRSAMSDPRRKPSRVRAAEDKAAAEAIERESAPRAERTAFFGAKPRRESGFGDKRPRSDRAPSERKSSGFGDKKPRSGGFSATRDEKRPRSDRAPSERKSSSFGDAKPRSAGFAARG